MGNTLNDLRATETLPAPPPKPKPEKSRPFGVTQVYPDPTNTTATKEKEIDIFVLHGLDARSDKTFIAWKVDGDKTSGDVHWLSDEDMLPSRMPQARVLTYDWNANYDKTASKETMRAHADTLLERVHLNRAGLVSSSNNLHCIVLWRRVAVSIGALELQHPQRQLRREIFESCIGLVFLGTPFRGSWDFGTQVALLRIEEARRANPEENVQYSMELVQYLKRGTDDNPSPLDDLMHRFYASMDNEMFKIPRAELYETLPAKFAGPLSRLSPEDVDKLTAIDKHGEGIVVSHTSAVLSGGDGSAQPMRHNMMHKYNSPDNPAFQSLCLRLNQFAEGAEKAMESRNQARLNELEAPASNELKSWLEALSFPNMNRRHKELEQNKAIPGTCEWLFKHEKYAAWEESDSADSPDSTLLIEGKAGSGKSTLMYKAVIRAETMLEDAKPICLSYFFNAAKDEGFTTQILPQGLYRSFLSQLLKKLKRSPEVVAIVREWGPGKKARQETLEDVVELKHKISSLLVTLDGRKVRIFIDDIDKCGSGRDEGIDSTIEMLKYIQSLNRKGPKVLTLFSIRDRAQYGSHLSGPTIEMSKHNEEDISKFVHDNLKYSGHSAVREGIIRTLVRSSSNIFLWAQIVVDSLNRERDKGLTDEELGQEVTRIPPKLEGLYADLLDSLNSKCRAEALIILQLIQALRYASDTDNVPGNADRTAEEFEAHIRDICRGFVEIQIIKDPNRRFSPCVTPGIQTSTEVDDLCETHEEDTRTPPPPKRLVQFTHDSVRDFLDMHGWGQLDAKSSDHSAVVRAHLEVTNLCMRAAGDAVTQNSFLPYAAHFWAVHARKSNEAIDEKFQPPSFVTNCGWRTKGVISRYLSHATKPDSLLHLEKAEIPIVVWFNDKATILTLLAFEGCGALITKHGEQCTRKGCCDDESTVRDAFALAMLRGWKTGVEAVRDLAQKQSITLDPMAVPDFAASICPLWWICRRNWHDILKSILNIGWDTTREEAGMSFCEGVKLGHRRIVELFLDNAADNNMSLLSWQSKDGYTALHFAASAGRLGIFQMLLDSLDEVPLGLMYKESKRGETVLDMAQRGKRRHEMRRDSDDIIKTIQEILEQ
ncbi:ankyrin repeat [Fusarium globosum]|uniref:Ankyrin repeat n=1 Tax=Fusarium globosum TaxID=78864 RepID=A0A8H6DH05_9HYPO|nr:ankyrin repeat [Fusarium globosum]